MPKGLIISNISNMYEVEDIENKSIIKCIPRGKFKKDEITPVVGDNIEFEYQDDGTKLTILYTGNTSPNIYEYKIEGDILLIKNSSGQETKYLRK